MTDSNDYYLVSLWSLCFHILRYMSHVRICISDGFFGFSFPSAGVAETYIYILYMFAVAFGMLDLVNYSESTVIRSRQLSLLD